ncbi:UNVERIFIED_ORG: hypothetical protein EDC93_110119 [Bacillus cereus]
MRLLYVLKNSAPVSPTKNPFLFSVLDVTSCTAVQNIAFLAFDFDLDKKVFLE